jgi:non-specific serine/threonine protein kinase
LTHVGETYLLQGDLERTTAASEEAVAMLREQKHRASLADALDNLGWVALLRGDPDQAKALYAESLRLRHEVGEKLMIGNSLEVLASAAAARGEAERAAKLFGAVEMLIEVMGASQGAAHHLGTEYDTLQGPYLAAARSKLDESSWHEAWAEGRAMTFEEAVAYALEEEADG